MNNKNLVLLFSAVAIVAGLAVLVPVLQNRQEIRQHAQGPDHPLPSQAWRNPHYNEANETNPTNPSVTITLPPEQNRYQAPNDMIPPQLTITNPQSNATVQSNSTVTIATNATDNIGVAKVEFLVNGQVICIDKTAPYQCAWQVPFQT